MDEAHLCESQADYDGLSSRALIATVLRGHLDPQGLIVSELLYGGKQLRQMLDQKAAVETALGRIAAVQGRLTGQDSKLRLQALNAAVDAVVKRCRACDTALVSVPRHMTALAAYEAGTIEYGAELGPVLPRAVLVRDLAGVSGWPAKFDFLISLVWKQSDPEMLKAVDEVLGDALLSVSAVRELVGPRATLGQTLCRLLDMMLGRISMDAGRPDRLATLSQLFRQSRLTEARGAVLERLRRQIKGPEPLGAGQAEADLLRTLLSGLVTSEGVAGGPGMAEALTLRSARRFDQGGSRGLRRAVATLSDSLAELPARLHYLAAIASSELVQGLTEEIITCAEAALTNEMPVGLLVLRSPDLALARRLLNQSAEAIAASGLPVNSRRQLAQRIVRVVDDFALSGDLLERLEAQESSPTRQALRLSDIVAAGLITDPRALVVVRQRLSALQRLPGFDSDLAAGGGSRGGGLGGGDADIQRFRAVVDTLQHLPDAASSPPPAEPSRETTMTMAQPPRRGAPQAQAPVPAQPTQTPPNQVPPNQVPPKPRAVQPPPPVSDVTVTMAAPVSAGRPRLAAGPALRPTTSQPTTSQPTSAQPSAARPISSQPGGPARSVSLQPAAAQARSSPPAAASADDGRCLNCYAARGKASACPECNYQPGVTPTSSAHLQPGTWLHDRFRSGKLLGQGGFGATYLGWDDRLQIKVAIKEYFPVSLVSRIPGTSGLQPYTAEHQETFTDGIRKFLDEARMLAKMRDIREIVGVQDYFEDNGTAYLVMELLQGHTLKKYLSTQGGSIDYRKALSILIPIMIALHQVHELGLVHRDISPDNIFLVNAGGAKLLDFGAARESTAEAGGGLTVILKPGYAPPEQYFADSRQGPWTDVYALAASFYCAITGRPPMDATRRLQDDALQPPSALGVAIPPEIEKVLMAGLALRRQDRLPSMKAMLTAFSKAG